LDIYKKQAKERQATSTGGKKPQLRENFPQADKGKSSDKAGETLNVSCKSIQRAEKVIKRGKKIMLTKY